MNLKQYLSPQTLKRFKSKHNINVELVTFSGSLRLDMGDLTQSGEVIEKIWNKAINDLLPKSRRPQSALILGFGAGSAAKLLARRYPGITLTGVELDPTVIDIARKHFNVDSIPNLTIHNSEAAKFVRQDNRQYDLILVDCYLGDQFPKSLESPSFLKLLVDKSPHVIINRLFWGIYQPKTLEFHEKLKKDFKTTTTRTTSNYLISLKK